LYGLLRGSCPVPKLPALADGANANGVSPEQSYSIGWMKKECGGMLIMSGDSEEFGLLLLGAGAMAVTAIFMEVLMPDPAFLTGDGRFAFLIFSVVLLSGGIFVRKVLP